MLPILNQSYWRDEAFSVLLSMKDPWEIIKLTGRDVSPPFYYIVLHYWMQIFGTEEVAVRAFSLMFQIFTTIVVFFIVRKLTHNLLASVLIALATLLNPFLLQYAFEGRAYSMLAFLTSLSVYLALHKKYILTSLVLGIMIFTHNFGIFTTMAFGVWWLVFHRGKKNSIEGLKLGIFPIIVALLWGSVVWTQWQKVAGGFWIRQPANSIFLHSFEVFTKGDITFLAQPMLYTITMLLIFFAFSYWIAKDKDEDNKEIALITFVCFLPFLITYAISALFAPIYHERYLIGSLPLFVVLIGYSLYKLFMLKKSLRYVLVVLIAFYGLLLWQGSEQLTAMTTKPALNYGMDQILAKAQPGDVVIPKDVINFLEAKYYLQKNGSNLPVYAYSPNGKIPFYIGSILYEPHEVITQKPVNTRIWELEPDGGTKLIELP